MLSKNSLFFVTMSLILVTQSCKKNDIKTDNISPTDVMVLVYIAANSDLKNDAINTINKLEEGYNKGNNNLLVFVKTTSKLSYLLKIKRDNTAQVKSDTIVTYINRNTSDPVLLKDVIEDSRNIAPAKEYGLVLWSHATAWLPPKSLKVRSFGYDAGREMDIRDLRASLPNDFTFILFDACYMGSIEAIYEFKNNSKYLIASPSEVLSTSFPYEVITPYLFGNLDDYVSLCKEYINYYSSQPAYKAYATVCLIKSSELAGLAYETKRLSSTLKATNIATDAVQRLDFEGYNDVKIYDFLDLLEKNQPNLDYHPLNDQLHKTLAYKGNTKYFFDFPINSFSGLGISLPEGKDEINYYKDLSWNTDSNWLLSLNLP